jgi:peptidoglycan/xylan/chitin deacetylase (PgdA/CDA1 family)
MYVDWDFLASLNKSLFSVGLHGHEHQRFSMMSPEWQAESIDKNLEILSELDTFEPIFAIPFGRPHDFTRETIQIALQRELRILLANGGVNKSFSVGYDRIPADGRDVLELYWDELALRV